MNNEQTNKSLGEVLRDYLRKHARFDKSHRLEESYYLAALDLISHVLGGAKYVLLDFNTLVENGDEELKLAGWHPVNIEWVGTKCGHALVRRLISLPSSVRLEGKPDGPSTTPPASSGASGADARPEAEVLWSECIDCGDVHENGSRTPEDRGSHTVTLCPKCKHSSSYRRAFPPTTKAAEPVVEEKLVRAPSTTELLEMFHSEQNPHHGINLVRNTVLSAKRSSLTSELDQLRKELESAKATFKVAEQEVIRLSTENAALKEEIKLLRVAFAEASHNDCQAGPEIEGLKKELAHLRSQFRWTPISERLPTEKDAVDRLVWVWDPSKGMGPRPIREVNYTNVGLFGEVHWMTPVPLPYPSPETEEQKWKKKWENEFEQFWSTGDDPNPGFAWTCSSAKTKAKAAFLAAKQPTP